MSSNNQDPIVVRFTGRKRRKVWCRTDYETTGADGRGVGLMLDGRGALFAIFTTDGTQGLPSEDFRRFTGGGWIGSYGRGGGAKVSVLARIGRKKGNALRGTFIKAVLSNGDANTLVVEGIDYSGRDIRVRAQSYFRPLGVDGKPIDTETSCGGATGSPFRYELILKRDLSAAKKATCSPY